MSVILSWNLWLACALCAATLLAAVLDPQPIFLGLCLIATLCFAIVTIMSEKDP